MKAENTWQDAIGKRWAEFRDRTDAQLRPLGRAAMELLAPKRGELVLDVGCGAGESTVELGAMVGPNGSVVGIDVSPELLEQARARAAESAAANVEFVLGDAEREHFDRPFDALFSRFGLMFFEDTAAAFGNLRQALRAGGRLGFVSWQSYERNPMMQAPLTAVQKLCPGQALPTNLAPGVPGPFALSDPALVSAWLEQGGFERVRIVEHEAFVPLGGALTLAEAVDFCLRIGPAARFLADAGLSDDLRVRDALGKALAPYTSERGVWMPARTLLVTAERSAAA